MVPSEEAHAAHAQLRLLQLQEAIAQDTLTFAQTRLDALVAAGKIAPMEHTRLLEQVSRELQQLRKQVTRSERLVSLHDLETTRQDIVAMFERTMAGLTTEIAEIHIALQAERYTQSDVPLRARSSEASSPAHGATTPWYAQTKILLPIILIAILLSTAPLTFGLLSAQRIMSSTGIIAGVDLGIFADSAGNTPLTRLEWGVMYPGDTLAKTLYLQNSGNQATTLQIETSNWNPSQASQYLTLRSDYGNEVLQPGEIIQVTLSLTLSSDVQDIQEFSFDIILTLVAS